MKVHSLAQRLNVPEDALAETQKALGIAEGQDLSTRDLDRLKDALSSKYDVDLKAFEKLRSAAPSAPLLPEPPPSGASTRPSGTTGVGRLDLSAFGNIGANITSRLSRNDLILKRKTRNCGDTAGMVLDGVRKRAETSTTRDVNLKQVLEALAKPAAEHQVWDITVHQHTFTLERHPSGENMLIQSYQPGYNVQHWCGLEDPYLDNDALSGLRKDWFQPNDTQVAELGKWIGQLYEGDPASQKEIWKSLPFNPQDPLVVSERMENLAFSANLISFAAETPMGATLAGLKDEIEALSG